MQNSRGSKDFVLGYGNIGQSLVPVLLEAGETVTVGKRNPVPVMGAKGLAGHYKVSFDWVWSTNLSGP